MTLDGGKTFKLIQNYVKTFFWSSGPGFRSVFYVERWKPGGNSTVLSVDDPTNMVNAHELFADAKDFQIKGDFMFATRQSKEVSFYMTRISLIVIFFSLFFVLKCES